jgi:hypothetical protein
VDIIVIAKMNKLIYSFIWLDIIDYAIDLSTNSFEVACLMPYNVRWYGQLAQGRGGARFCTRDAMKDYAVICLFSHWQKP